MNSSQTSLLKTSTQHCSFISLWLLKISTILADWLLCGVISNIINAARQKGVIFFCLCLLPVWNGPCCQIRQHNSASLPCGAVLRTNLTNLSTGFTHQISNSAHEVWGTETSHYLIYSKISQFGEFSLSFQKPYDLFRTFIMGLKYIIRRTSERVLWQVLYCRLIWNLLCYFNMREKNMHPITSCHFVFAILLMYGNNLPQ